MHNSISLFSILFQDKFQNKNIFTFSVAYKLRIYNTWLLSSVIMMCRDLKCSLIFKNIWWFQQMIGNNWPSICKKKTKSPNLNVTPITKINWKWIIDLNVKHKTKNLEERYIYCVTQVPLLYIYSWEMKLLSTQNLWRFIKVTFISTKNWKQHTCPPMDE